MNEQSKIPRKLWILWFQGFDNAPFVVQKCVTTWISMNPNWEIIMLDADSMKNYLDIDLSDPAYIHLSPNHRSNIVRLSLLSQYGGVWADATAYCMKPLDEWIDDAGTSGFFAFCHPSQSKIMSNYFLAAEKNCPLVQHMYKRYCAYWNANRFPKPNAFQKFTTKVLHRLLNRSTSTTRYWFSPLVTKVLKITPYFGFHYMFERLIATDPVSKKIWDSTTKINAATSLYFYGHSFLQPNMDNLSVVNDSDTPLFKLTWKYDHQHYHKDTLLYYLLEGKQ